MPFCTPKDVLQPYPPLFTTWCLWSQAQCLLTSLYSLACVLNMNLWGSCHLAGGRVFVPALLPILSRYRVFSDEFNALRKFGCWGMVGGTCPEDTEWIEQTPKKNCVYGFLPTCMIYSCTTCVPGTHGGLKRALDPRTWSYRQL